MTLTTDEFRTKLYELRDTNSRNTKKDIIRDVSESAAAISLLSGSEFDDVGIGKTTARSVAEEVFPDYKLTGQPTLSEEIAEFEEDVHADGRDLAELRKDMNTLADLSGSDMEGYLFQMFVEYTYPSVVAHACLNDWPTGVSDTTIANALDIRDSLPFYDSVVDIVEAPNAITRPAVHNPFDPMLAKSESSLPEDLSNYVAQLKIDGHRLLIHITDRVRAFTRRGNDVTESLPELQEIDWPTNVATIIDCEVIAETGDYSDTSERIGRNAENVTRDIEMNFAIFDVICYEGKFLYNKPYKNRYGWTVTISDLTPDERVGALPIYTDEEEAKRVASDYEGLIWKDTEAEYEFGKRSTAWVKEKHKAETVDVVATEFVEGEGRLDGTLGKIKIESADGEPVGYTGSGLTDEQRNKIWNNQEQYLGEPLEVEAEALDSSLRFPIFQRWRTTDGEADTLERIEEVMPTT
jgi:hypothetical protein